ncbi:hypothetical protein [Anaerotignum sp.]
MTEQERRRRRRERERRMRTGAGARKKTEKKGGLTAFRLYVTTILVGGCLLVSLFHTESSEMVCARVKDVIAMEISMEELEKWKNRAMAYFVEKDIVFPVFKEKESEEGQKGYHPDTEP